MTRALKRLALRIARRLWRHRLPHEAYTRCGARLHRANKRFRYTVERSGIDHLDAYQWNLWHTLSLLEDAGVEHSLLSTADEARPRLVLPRPAVPRFLAAAARAAQLAPYYLWYETVERERRTVLALDASELDIAGLRSVCLFVYYRDSASGQRFGVGHGPHLEVWEEDDTGWLTASRPNRRATTIGSDVRARPATTHVHGRRVAVYEPLAQPTPFEVPFPIDLVYLWVDGADPDWQRRKAQRLAELTGAPMPGANSASLFEQGDELRFSLRSAERFAPWVRRIFLVTDARRPRWLRTEGTNLQVVDHRDILPESALPTFNSHAISAAVHRIPGLADHFLLMNDDVLLGRPVPPSRFFHANGATRFFLSTSTIPDRPLRDEERALIHARHRTRDLIARETGQRPSQVFRHTAIAFDRTYLEELAARIPEWTDTMHSPFRSSTDIVPEWLHHYLGYAERRAFPGELDYRYVAIGSHEAMRRLRRLSARSRPEVLCVNDVIVDVDAAARHAQLRRVLELHYPHPSSYERSGVTEHSTAAADDGELRVP